MDVKDIKNNVLISNDTNIRYNKDGFFDKNVCPNFDDDVINKLNELIDLLKDFKLDEGVREVFNSNWKVYKTDVFRDSFINIMYKGKDFLMFLKDGGVVNLIDNRSIDNINTHFVSNVILDKIKDKIDTTKYLKGSFYDSYKQWKDSQVKNDRSK